MKKRQLQKYLLQLATLLAVATLISLLTYLYTMHYLFNQETIYKIDTEPVPWWNPLKWFAKREQIITETYVADEIQNLTKWFVGFNLMFPILLPLAKFVGGLKRKATTTLGYSLWGVSIGIAGYHKTYVTKLLDKGLPNNVHLTDDFLYTLDQANTYFSITILLGSLTLILVLLTLSPSILASIKSIVSKKKKSV